MELKEKCLRLEQLAEKVKELSWENQKLNRENESLINENQKLADQLKSVGRQEMVKQEVEDIDSKIERIIEEKLSFLLEKNRIIDVHKAEVIVNAQSQGTTLEVDSYWESVPSEELKKSKGRGAVEEKLKRSFLAIANHNDYKARDNNGQPDQSKMWAITNQALRQLSGCNGQLVKVWMENHRIAIDDHHNKYGLGQYHNKGKGDITQAISW